MYIIRNEAGETSVVNDLDGYDGWEVIAEDVAEPVEHEEWDEVEGAWKLNALVKADTDAGAEHIAKAHTLKQLEAAVVLSGVSLTHGILFEEAAALGVPLSELAQNVSDNAAAFRAAEVARRETKTTARGGEPYAD